MSWLRRGLLLHPFELPVAFCLLLVSVIFTIFPEALEHSAVSFETRGIIHHVWHYTLLTGSLLVVVGVLLPSPRGLDLEFAGLLALGVCLALNIVAVTADEVTGGGALSGLALALRVGVLLGVTVRLWIIRTSPTVVLPVSPDA